MEWEINFNWYAFGWVVAIHAVVWLGVSLFFWLRRRRLEREAAFEAWYAENRDRIA